MPDAERWVELRLTGTALTALADNAHIPGWPGLVGRIEVADDDPDRDLHVATVAWYRHATGRRVGATGTVITGNTRPEYAETILNYLESVAGALCASPDADAKAEGRAVGRSVDQAAEHMRRQGVTVMEIEDGPNTRYGIEV